MRLLAQIDSHTLFRGRGSNFGPGQRSLHSPIQSRESAGKGCHGNSSRFYSYYLLVPKSGGLRPILALSRDKAAVQDVNLKTNPLTHFHRELFFCQ